MMFSVKKVDDQDDDDDDNEKHDSFSQLHHPRVHGASYHHHQDSFCTRNALSLTHTPPFHL